MFGLQKKGKGMKAITKTVTTAGTPEKLSASHLFCKYIHIQAKFGNTGAKVAIGDSNVHLVNEVGIVLAKGNSFSIYGNYLDEIYIDVGTNGDKVSAIYEER